MEYAGKDRDRSPLSGVVKQRKEADKPKTATVLIDEDTGLDWQPVKDYISKPQTGDLSNLERLQRVAGALGQRAEDVRFGLSGPTLKEIGKLLGKEEAAFPR